MTSLCSLSLVSCWEIDLLHCSNSKSLADMNQVSGVGGEEEVPLTTHVHQGRQSPGLQ